MSAPEPEQEAPEAAPGVRPSWPKLGDNALLGWLLAREAFHLRNAIRQTRGRTRKHAFARLEQVQELLRRCGGPYPLWTAEAEDHATAVLPPHPIP